MARKLKLNIIIGSTRPGRNGPKVAEWIRTAAETNGLFEVKVIDLASFNLPLLDEPGFPAEQDYRNAPTKAWSAAIDAADAFVFLTPEYDYFPPASLVNAVQVLLLEWAYKPAGVVSYGGISGGLRAAQGLRQLLGNVNVHPLPQVVPVPSFWDHIGADGAFTPTQPMADGAEEMLTELHKWAVALEALRSDEADAPAKAA